MPTTDERPDEAARRLLGLERLRPGQAEALEATLEGRDVLAVMPTGHGKSALYQVPGAVLGGVSLVVSPLLALQRDQARFIGSTPALPRAWTLNSRTAAATVRKMWSALEAGEPGFVFVTAEQLADEDLVTRLGRLELSQVVVDEAHCISAWGHDFRPDYLRLGGAVERLGHPRVVALTATASKPVRDEVVDRLGLRDPLVVVRGFDRPNLHLSVHRDVADADKRRHVVETVRELGGTGLVYVATRRDTTRYADELAGLGVNVAAYHGGMRSADRARTHERFTAKEVDVVVATSAFGMGIDRPDVRFVVHASAPSDPDSYYQEIGRAGRDGEPAQAVLLYRPEDLGLHRFHSAATVDEQLLRRVLRVIRGGGGEGLTMTELRRAVDGPARTVTRLVNLLELGGAVGVRRSRVRAVAQDDPTAVAAAVDAAEVRMRVERTRLEMMRGYAETSGCRRQFLLGYLGEQLEHPCGHCDRCEEAAAQAGVGDSHPEPRGDGTSADRSAGDSAPFPVNSRVTHTEWGDGVVLSTEEDRLTVLFEREGYRVLSTEAVQEESLLARSRS